MSHCIQNTESKIPTFVMHRLNEITKSTKLKQWNCISGKIIPADMCTRALDIMEKLDSPIFDTIAQLGSNEKQPNSEAVTRGVLCKKVFLKVSQNLQENTCTRVSFLKKDSGTGVLL